MKKIRLENTSDFKGEKIKVFKSDYEIYRHIDNYYSIRLANTTFGSNVVWGGDSAWADCYEKKLAQSVYEQWDGTLTYSERYGYTIEM